MAAFPRLSCLGASICVGSILGAVPAPDSADLSRRGFFGCQVTDVRDGNAVKVGQVAPAGYAAAAHLIAGDIISSLNGATLTSTKSFRETVRTIHAGDKVTVTYRRGDNFEMHEVTAVMPELPRETYQSAEVIYDTIKDRKAQRLRIIITKPKTPARRLPVIFIVGWLSCDAIEAPDGTKDATSLVLRHLAELPSCVTFRLDKPGCGDSEGTCAETDFDTELDAYRAAFQAMRHYDFIDPDQVFIFGISNGGGFAPLVPSSDEDVAGVRGYVSMGGWSKTWFEHMLEIERRRLTLSGKPPGQVAPAMKELARLYSDLLLNGSEAEDAFKNHPAAAQLWPGEDERHLYGRPLAFYQQLQQLNLADAWSKVNVPTLVLRGEFDWIMSRDEQELIALCVNRNQPGAARLVEFPHTGHTFENYPTLAESFADKVESFDRAVLKPIDDWLQQQSLSAAEHTLPPQPRSR